jgi:hypothetical protein
LALGGGGDTDGGDGGEGDGDGTDGGGDTCEGDVADDGNGLGRLNAANANANAFANANGNSVVVQIAAVVAAVEDGADRDDTTAALSEIANVELTDEIIDEIIALLQLEFAVTDDEGDGTGDDEGGDEGGGTGDDEGDGTGDDEGDGAADDEGDGEHHEEDDSTLNEFGGDIVPF